MDADDPSERPVLLSFRTGKRLNASQSTSLRNCDIQKDSQYCPWCGTPNWKHYNLYFAWIPCRKIVQHL
jgi:hypothetical protein